jgi:hypothetical protein
MPILCHVLSAIHNEIQPESTGTKATSAMFMILTPTLDIILLL